MLNIFKKNYHLVAPIDGRTIDLSEVPDPVFSKRMTGDGIALLTTGDTVVAPCDGTVTLLFDSNHAFAVTTPEGIEVLVHVGLETVSLHGEGFTALQKIGSKVAAGTPILKLDRVFIESQGLNLITPVLIINHAELSKLNLLVGQEAAAGKTPIAEYKI